MIARRAPRPHGPLASFPFTMSNSVRFFVPAPQSCVRVLAFLLHPRCVRLVTRPRNEGAGGAPGGALPVVALVGRDATLARRGAFRANTGTPPLGAPPRRCRPRNRSGPGTICGIRPVGCSRPAIVMAGYGTGLFVHGFTAAIDATPRSACWIVSGDAPHERGWRFYIPSSLRSQ